MNGHEYEQALLTRDDRRARESGPTRSGGGRWLLPAITACGLWLPLAAQPGSDPMRAETYGRPSGTNAEYVLPSLGGGEAGEKTRAVDAMVVEYGLILELIGGHTERPVLRLFGGSPGNEAQIMVSTSRAQMEFGEATMLVGPDPVVCAGVFDQYGYFEVPIDKLGQADEFYAQGLHRGLVGPLLAPAEVLELSNGLRLFRGEPEPELPFSFDPTDPSRLSGDPRGTAQAMLLEQLAGMDFVEFLGVALNSPGDEVAIRLDATCAIVVGWGNVEGFALELRIQRTANDQYLLFTDWDAALSQDIVAEIAENRVYVGVEIDPGQTQVYRFHSIQGVSRAVHGLVLAQVFPTLSSKFDGSALIAMAYETVVKAREVVAKLQEALTIALRKVREVREEIRELKRRLNGAKRELERRLDELYTRWFPRLWGLAKALDAEIAKLTARIDAKQVVLNALSATETATRILVSDAADELARADAKLYEALAMARVATAIAQIRWYVRDHRISASAELDPEVSFQQVNRSNRLRRLHLGSGEERTGGATPAPSFSLGAMVVAYEREFAAEGIGELEAVQAMRMVGSIVWTDRDPLRGLANPAALLRRGLELSGSIVRRVASLKPGGFAPPAAPPSAPMIPGGIGTVEEVIGKRPIGFRNRSR